MSFLLGPSFKCIPALALAGCLLPAAGLLAQVTPITPLSPALDGAGQHLQFPGEQDALLNHANCGYLGVGTRDIGTQEATALKLKDARGAEIVAVDHDAPAGKAGLKIHDVILSINGQTIAGEAQLRRILRETPPGRTVTLVISRDGQQQTLSIKLADRSRLEAKAWSQHIPVPEPEDSDEYALPATGSGYGNGFLPGMAGSLLYTGLQLDVIGPQLASYFGVPSGHGLLVKHVDDDSPGSNAGLRAGDVVMRVNGKTVTSPSQWERLLHSNSGKTMRLTVMRDHRQQMLKMVAGEPKTRGALEWPESGAQWLAERMAVPPAELAHEVNAAMRQESTRMLAQMDAMRRRIESLHGTELE